MRARKSIGFGFGSVFALALVLVGLAASASGQTASLSGTVQGGLGPVVGAEVALYAAGTAYGAKATGLGTALTDSSGNFTVVYTPRGGHAVLYLVARGGNAGAGTNPAIGLMGLVGMSNAIPASVTINELTTVAAEWALAQFIDATGQIIGAPKSNATGLANAANQAQANLVDIATGAPASFWAHQGATAASCTGTSPPVNCDGLERLNTIANILAACVESSTQSSQCATLSATGSGHTTLGTAHHMAKPSGDKGLFALQSSSPPFTPALSAAPDGWEIALNFAPSGANLDESNALAIDAAGDVWVTSLDSVTKLTPIGGLIGTFDPNDSTALPSSLAVDAKGNIWVTYYDPATVTELTASGGLAGKFNNANTSGANFDGLRGLAIDGASNVWVTNYRGNSVTELTSSGGLVGNFDPSGANFNAPRGIAIDAGGDAWVTNANGTYDGASVTELTSSGSLAGNFDPSGADFDFPQAVAIDAAGNVWVTNLYSLNNPGGGVTELTSRGALAGSLNNANTSGANFNGPSGVAIDAAGDAWVTNYVGNSVIELTASGGLAGNFAPIGANFSNPNNVAIDAAGNVWVTNLGRGLGGLGGSVAEIVGAARPVLTPKVACFKQSPPHAVCLP